jgi:hypothetical protein
MQCSFVSKIIGVISNWNTSSNWNAFFRLVSVPVRGGGLYPKFNKVSHFFEPLNFNGLKNCLQIFNILYVSKAINQSSNRISIAIHVQNCVPKVETRHFSINHSLNNPK